MGLFRNKSRHMRDGAPPDTDRDFPQADKTVSGVPRIDPRSFLVGRTEVRPKADGGFYWRATISRNEEAPSRRTGTYRGGVQETEEDAMLEAMFHLGMMSAEAIVGRS